MSNKEAYIRFAEQVPELPIFFQPWFLDVVCKDGSWDALVVELAGKVAAILPFYKKRKGIFEYITMPELCKFMGPWIAPNFRGTKQEQKLLVQLAAQIPKVDFINQNFHYSINNWLPFYWEGFQETLLYSYQINDLSDLKAVYANFNGDYRNNKIKKAKEVVHLQHDLGIDAFCKINQKSFERQNIAAPYSLEYLRKIDTALAEHNCRKIFFAVDDEGQIHSVVYIIWDQECAYYLMAGDDPELRKSGAGIFLVWEILQFVKNELDLNRFDFLGSVIEPIERVRRNFGATQIPYHNVRKYNSPIFWLKDNLFS